MNPTARTVLLVVLAVAAVAFAIAGIIYIGDHPKRSAASFVVAVLCAGGAGFVFMRGSTAAR